MSVLDDPNAYLKADPTRMVDRLASLPDQCLQAWEACASFVMPKHYRAVTNIVFLGVGGSAIGGDLIAGLVYLEDKVPVTILRGYDLPKWVSSETLAIASSYSGGTEETISMYTQARELGACTAVVAGGGKLYKMAEQDNVPLFTIPYKGEARSAIGYSFVVPLALISKLGLIPQGDQKLREAVHVVKALTESLSPDVPLAQNLAKTLAESIRDRLPVVYGAGFLTGVARRWKTQLNENSKVWAFAEELPELAHNSVEGYSLPGNVKDAAYVVLLHSPYLHPRISSRYRAVEELFLNYGIPHRRINGVGTTPLAHLLSSVVLGDYVSYYLAILNGVDPASQDVINKLKLRVPD